VSQGAEWKLFAHAQKQADKTLEDTREARITQELWRNGTHKCRQALMHKYQPAQGVQS
jgi:hypothetical protein